MTHVRSNMTLQNVIHLSKLHLRSIRTTVCPEPFIDLRIEPGEESTWRMTYEFYRVAP